MTEMDILPPKVERQRGEKMMQTVMRLHTKYGSIEAIPEDDPEFMAVREYNKKVHRKGKPGLGSAAPIGKRRGRVMTTDRRTDVEQEVDMYKQGESLSTVAMRFNRTPGQVKHDFDWARHEGILPSGQRTRVIKAWLGDDVFVGTKHEAAKHFGRSLRYFMSGHATDIQWEFTGDCVFVPASEDKEDKQ